MLIEFSLKVTLSSPCLWASFYPQTRLWVRSAMWGNFIKSRYEMLKLSTGAKVIIVAVQVGVVKIHVAAVEALRKKERGGGG